MSDEIKSADIIDFQTGTPVIQLKKDDREMAGNLYCPHDQVLLDAVRHFLTCRGCGQVLDPWTWACRAAKDESYLMGRLNNLRDAVNEAQKRLDHLIEEQKRVKGSIARAKKSLVDAALRSP